MTVDQYNHLVAAAGPDASDEQIIAAAATLGIKTQRGGDIQLLKVVREWSDVMARNDTEVCED